MSVLLFLLLLEVSQLWRLLLQSHTVTTSSLLVAWRRFSRKAKAW
nr:MAG TPA: hypothetical protein [Caudoviricetes sp.]